MSASDLVNDGKSFHASDFNALSYSESDALVLKAVLNACKGELGDAAARLGVEHTQLKQKLLDLSLEDESV